MGDCIPRLRQPIKEVERRCPLTQPIPEGLQPACYRRGRQRHGGARPTAAAGGRGKEGPRRGSALRLSRQRPSLQSGLWPGCGTPAGPEENFVLSGKSGLLHSSCLGQPPSVVAVCLPEGQAWREKPGQTPSVWDREPISGSGPERRLP